MNSKLTIAALVLLAVPATFAVAGASLAQDKTGDTPPAGGVMPLPTVDQILSSYIAATGGKEAYEKIKNSIVIEAITIPQGKATITVTLEAPNKAVIVQEFTGMKETMGVNGNVGWHVGMMGNRIMSGEELAQALREIDPQLPLNFKKHYAEVSVKSLEKYDDVLCYLVLASPTAGADPQKYYFEMETGLLRGLVAKVKGAMGEVSIATVMTDYRAVNGVKTPFKKVANQGPIKILFDTQSIKHNVTLPKGTFDVPEIIQEMLERRKGSGGSPKSQPKSQPKLQPKAAVGG